MGSKVSENDMKVTQVSIAGFDRYVKAKDLRSFLEDKVGVVDRCRLKTSWTPRKSYPNFEMSRALNTGKTNNYDRVEPHAFVHFALPDSATWAFNAAGRCELNLNNKQLKVILGPANPFHLNKRRRTTKPIKLSDVYLEIGNLASRDDFVVAWRGPLFGVSFIVDPFDDTCKFCFTRDTVFSFKGTTNYTLIKCDFKVQFSVGDIKDIEQCTNTSQYAILLHLASSPHVWYRTADDDIDVSVAFDLLDDDDPWIRTTDFTSSGAIGRCNSYRISTPGRRHSRKSEKAIQFLKQRRVQEGMLKWPFRVYDEPDFGTPMSDTFFYVHCPEGIDFEVMFIVNSIVNKGIFNQHQISNNFFDTLRNQEKEVNVAALKHIYSYECPVLDACARLKLVQQWLLRNPKFFNNPKQSDDIAEVRRLVITPTKAYCLPPEVELSNRVLREYKEVADRFLRVTFMDEGMQTLNSNVLTYYAAPIVKEITSSSYSQKTKIFDRMRSILRDGFYLCGRKYSFLAFSSNQLRDRSAWFFAEERNRKISVADIRSWMGTFTNRNIAKCAARMGQCFSSTYATVKVPTTEVEELEDILRNGYNFSDGIGMIAPDLAMEVVEKLKLDMKNPPCAYQIRYAGCKGVLACWPRKDDGIRLSLRPSMNKFQSKHTTLEICSWTRFQPAFLNREIVTLLSTLGVSDDIFWKMQETMISKLHQMLVNEDVAYDVLTASCAEQGNVAALMLIAGFKPQSEPHLRGMLTCIRAAQLWGLREKARIFVHSGRWLMGCLDELGVLEQGQCFIQVSTPSMENCFSKHGSQFNETKNSLQVIKGLVVMAKNPCLHPGDVRILEAVDAPYLHHLYDCLVFPQKGDRPHANEASGSDLDGDLYFVTWDGNLIPPSKKSVKPMEYTPAETKNLDRAVTHPDIIEFFVKNIVNESLGAICHAHVVHADISARGALDENCLKLAELAATAVDFPKTGKTVTMPFHLKPKQYPDFMGKEEYLSYKSNKILGRLYRKVKDAYNEDEDTFSELNCVGSDVTYDTELQVPGTADFVLDAWDQKCSYDMQLKGLLRQYKVKREEEVVTGHVWSIPKYNSRKRSELMERLKHSYNALKKEFRKIFETMDSNLEQQLTDDEKNMLYEQKASAWYEVTYHPKWVKKSVDLCEPDDLENVILLSFPWIAADYLARIKIRCHGVGNVDSTKPLNSLARYVAERMTAGLKSFYKKKVILWSSRKLIMARPLCQYFKCCSAFLLIVLFLLMLFCSFFVSCVNLASEM